MATRKSTCACAGRLPVVTNVSTVGLPRVASALTARSSSESYSKATGAPLAAVDAPGGEIPDGPPEEPPHATSSRAAAALLVALLPHELVFTIGKEDVERGQRTVATRDVLL